MDRNNLFLNREVINFCGGCDCIRMYVETMGHVTPEVFLMGYVFSSVDGI